jgi:hypothetical protein
MLEGGQPTSPQGMGHVLPVEVGLIVNKDLTRLRDQPYLVQRSAMWSERARGGMGGRTSVSSFSISGRDRYWTGLRLKRTWRGEVRAIACHGGVEGLTILPRGRVAEGGRPRRRLGRTQMSDSGIPQSRREERGSRQGAGLSAREMGADERVLWDGWVVRECVSWMGRASGRWHINPSTWGLTGMALDASELQEEG